MLTSLVIELIINGLKINITNINNSVKTIDNFVIDYSDNYGVVIEVRYDEAYILYNGEVVLAKLRKDVNLICNQVIFPGDKVDIVKVNDNYVINHLLKRTSILSRTKKIARG